MSRFWVVTVMGVFGRMVAIAGAALTVGAIVAYVSGWVVSAIRYAPDWNVGIIPLVFVLQVVVAGWVLWSALMRDARRLLRNQLVAFVLSFLLLYGWYFFLAGWGRDPVSIGNLLYLLAGLSMLVAVLSDASLGDARPQRGARGEEISREVGGGARALGAIFFVAAAATADYAAMPPMPPEPETLSLSDEPSCPEYLDEVVAAFRGMGDRMTPPFEVSGYWGYEYASTGYGTIKMTLLDEDGNAVYGGDEPAIPAGDSVGGGEYASGGSFRLDIEADDDAKYAVVVCDGAGPGAAKGGSPDQ